MTYSANDNQNFFVQQGRTTSRVLSQPGGQSSFSLGGWTPEELERQRQQREAAVPAPKPADPVVEKQPVVESKATPLPTPTPVAAEENESKPVNLPTPPKEEESKPVAAAVPARVSSNAFASSSTTNSFNVLTDRPTSRVSRPPGGHCSIRLG